MSKGGQLHFFATGDDVHKVLAKFEVVEAIRYTLGGSFKTSQIESYTSHIALPEMWTATHPNAIAGRRYLITPVEEYPRPIETPQTMGGIVYVVDQRSSVNSIVFMPSGLYEERVLLYGKVSTICDSEIALQLYKRLSAIIRKSFTRLKTYWVGDGAMRLLDTGYRLTLGANSPAEFDLHR
jgi:hypothetical protein